MNSFDMHEVFNQAASLENFNLFACDPALREALRREGGAAAQVALYALGERLGRAETLDLAHNSIWEGSGNVMCLDMLRAFGKTDAAREALAGELAHAGGELRLRVFVECLLADLRQPVLEPYDARRLAERVVLAVQAGLLLRHAPPFVSDAFIASRLAQDVGGAYGRLPPGVDCNAILGRALVMA